MDGPSDFNLTRRGVLAAGAASAAVSVGPAAALAATEARPAPTSMPVVFKVNGKKAQLSLDTRTTLLDALREHLKLAGTKKGCDHGQCGACTVIVNGGAVLSCAVTIGSLEGAEVTTIEGLAGHPLTMALVAEDAIGCGFCLPGFTCAAAALLQQSSRPAAEQVDALPAGQLVHRYPVFLGNVGDPA